MMEKRSSTRIREIGACLTCPPDRRGNEEEMQSKIDHAECETCFGCTCWILLLVYSCMGIMSVLASCSCPDFIESESRSLAIKCGCGPKPGPCCTSCSNQIFDRYVSNETL